jgi:hypothetical protein
MKKNPRLPTICWHTWHIMRGSILWCFGTLKFLHAVRRKERPAKDDEPLRVLRSWRFLAVGLCRVWGRDFNQACQSCVLAFSPWIRGHTSHNGELCCHASILAFSGWGWEWTRLGRDGGSQRLGRPEAGGWPTPDPHPHLEAYLTRGKGYQWVP